MYEPDPPKPLAVRFQETLAASRFLTVSVLLHVIIVLMGGGVVLFKQVMDAPDFEAAEGGLIASETVVQAPPEQPPDLTQQFKPETPQISAPTMSALSTTNVTTPTFQVAAPMPVAKVIPSDAMNNALQKAAQTMGKPGLASNIPGTMAARVGGTKRAMAMQMNGGKKESEEAVMRGLRWLVKNQNPDGSWSKSSRPTVAAMTGFGILSFLGHGETPVSAEFGPTIQKALDFLVTNGAKNGGRLALEPTITQQGSYAHAIAAYALGEYYTMTKDERVMPVLKDAVSHIVKGQSPDGSWRYSYSNDQHPDTSVSGWNIQALKAAHLTELKIEGVEAAMDKAMVYLKSVQGPKGGFGYKDKEDRYSLTGVGVLCTYFWKQDKDESVRRGIEFMMDSVKSKFPVEYRGENADLYAWYYNTQACLMVGGAAWNTWNRLFQDQIVKNQNPDGSWPPVKTSSPGELKNPEGYGPFYRTNLCILMLEVYYRYMPTTK